MKKLLLSAALIALGTSAHAVTATFDFVNLSNTVPGETEVELDVFTDNGLGVLLDASGDDFAYLDGSVFPGPPSSGDAGLGVCQNPSCVGVNDDNINPGERVTLRFSNVVTDISGLVFNNETHTGPAVGTFEMRVQYADLTTDTFSVDFATTALAFGQGVNSISFGYGGDNADDFYLGALTANFDPDRQTPPVPLPAGLPLLVGGLAALGLASRRRKNA